MLLLQLVYYPKIEVRLFKTLSVTISSLGISWSVGGDYTYTKIVSLPNVLRQYNSNLQGFSTRMSSMFSDAKYNRLNVGQ
jgi:hypothetical protein